MPLTAYQRGPTWWVKGRIEYNGLAISPYYRRSTGAHEKAGADDWIRHETERQIRQHLLGHESSLTFADAAMLYPAKPKEARYLVRILPEIGDQLVSQIAPQDVRALGRALYPNASTDTWKRQVISPISAVINNAHDKGQCPPIRIRGYSAQDRIDQDAKRGKQSRAPRAAGSWDWIRSVQPHANPWVSAGLEFMFETGCRISQLVAITPRDVNLTARTVRLIAQKGHAAQDVVISHDMMITLANLKPRKPHAQKQGYRLPARTFGYADRSGFTAALRSACGAAGVTYLSPHQAGRHGFYTELRVRQGIDSLQAAKAGRWSNATLPDRVYGHAETPEADLRAAIRTSDVHGPVTKPAKVLKSKR